MEKVKVKSVEIKEGTKNGKNWKIFKVLLEDGRKGDCFDEMKEGMEYEIEIKPDANPNYSPKFILQKEQRKGFATKDYTLEKRKVALELAVSMVVAKITPADKTKEQADKFFAYLNEK